MITIRGEFNEAKCFATTVEDAAIVQIKDVCNIAAYKDSKIRIMPDVHAGVGCTIGTTMTVTDKVSPSLVGVDIGCGMHTVYLGNVDIDFEKVDEVAHYIPSGMEVWEDEDVHFDLTQLRFYDMLHNKERLERSLGTLGGGNHFIEIDVDDEGGKYLVIHSGSRNLGHQVANVYQNLAAKLLSRKEEYQEESDRLIATYKAEGRKCEIKDALKRLKAEFKANGMSIPKSLCYLTGQELEDYLHDVDICQRFAAESRERMAEIFIRECGFTAVDSFTTIHNYIDMESMILRKGSVSAKAGEKLLIPINMRDGALICIGKGNEDWNCSAPHGAGRLMSRTAAVNTITMDEYVKSMQGIYTTTVNCDTLDESPMAYKSIDEIVANIEPTVEIVKRIRPIYNFKAAE